MPTAVSYHPIIFDPRTLPHRGAFNQKEKETRICVVLFPELIVRAAAVSGPARKPLKGMRGYIGGGSRTEPMPTAASYFPHLGHGLIGNAAGGYLANDHQSAARASPSGGYPAAG